MYDLQDSKLSVLFSSETGGCSASLRKVCYEIIEKTTDNDFQEIFDNEYRIPLIKQIGLLEFALKADIGIFVLEYKDFDGTLGIRSYEDVLNTKRKQIT